MSLRGYLHVKSHIGTSFTLARVVGFIWFYMEDTNIDAGMTNEPKSIMASNEVLVSRMFFSTSAITLSNSIASVLLNPMA